MITEDYCSFEIAKLLKEKGLKCGATFSKGFVKDGDGFVGGLVRHEASITHQLAIKWLREIKKIFINIRYVPESKDDNIGPCYVVDIYSENNGGWVPNSIVSISFEEASEESLTFCLTELI